MYNDKGRDPVYVTQLVDCFISIDPDLTQFRYGPGSSFLTWFYRNMQGKYANVILEYYPQLAYRLLLMAWDINHVYHDAHQREATRTGLFDLFTGNMDLDKLKDIVDKIYSSEQRATLWTQLKLTFCEYLAVHENTHKARSPWLQMRDGHHPGPVIKVRQ